MLKKVIFIYIFDVQVSAIFKYKKVIQEVLRHTDVYSLFNYLTHQNFFFKHLRTQDIPNN